MGTGAVMIYIIEGADGTGKSTLARQIAKATNGNVLHQTWDKDWNMEEYHTDTFVAAIELSQYKPIVLDRWALSEEIYGNVFRNGPSYNVKGIILEAVGAAKITWIYCRNDNVVKNHNENRKKRDELFETMEGVQEAYDAYVKATPSLSWKIFDYSLVNTDNFIKEII